MLREALTSIQQQTAVDSIARIIVSENSVNTDSESVCAEFGTLPILYTQQSPSVSALAHVAAIWHLVQSPLVAVLHDDDWWAPHHLQAALDMLHGNEACVATYSSFLESHGPQSFGWLSQCYLLSWLATGGDFAKRQYLDSAGVMLACLINAGFHYSTVVGRKEAMWEAFAQNIRRGNTFDNDRTFPVFLSQFGPIGYIATPDVFVRQHPFRDAWSPEHLARGHMKMSQETTRWLLANYPKDIDLAADRFLSVVERLSPNEARKIWSMLRHAVYEPQWSTLVRDCGINLTAVKRQLPDGLLPGWINWMIHEACPPALLRWVAQTGLFGGWEQQIRRWQKKTAN